MAGEAKRPLAADLPYRPCVGVILLNPRAEIFVGRRIDTPEPAWQLPQGGIDPGEEPQQAALRELREEVGTDKAEILAESRAWLSYDIPPDLVGQVWGGCFRGQRQKWFALRFLGQDSEIDLTAHEDPEFEAWRWAALEELPALAVPFKRKLYQDLVTEFEPLVSRLRQR